MQGATPVPLMARAAGWLEAKQAEHLLHRDFGAKPVEVDPWHGSLSTPKNARGRRRQDRSVPPLYIGNGERSFGHPLDALPTRRRAAEPAGSLQVRKRLA